MHKGRLEAFSDGVIAIIITIMVLEMKSPTDASLNALRPVLPVFLGYVLSYVNVGIYWNNHHHIFQAVERVDGMTLWANLHLLFWLSLIPFFTRWVGESHFGKWPVAIYGAVLLMCGFAWEIERRMLLRLHRPQSALAKAMGSNSKEVASLVIYLLGVGAAFLSAWVAFALYFLVAAIWFVPDHRIEREMKNEEDVK